MQNTFKEYNFDGLVGPTHNYAGLALGNIASSTNVNIVSSPKAAALEGLHKMKLLHDKGFKQAVLPPQPRPDLAFLNNLGFTGSVEKVLKDSQKYVPRLFSASYSASSMWTANAATVSPSPDTRDNRLYITPANLANNIHRAIEAEKTYNILKAIFNNQKYFSVNKYLLHTQELGDEGAANHTRFCNDYGSNGIGLFVYGREYYNNNSPIPIKFPARQTKEASQAIARQHGLDFNKVVFMQQHPDAIDAGVFHNDVCAVGNRNVLLCHEQAFFNQTNAIKGLSTICEGSGIDLNLITVNTCDLPFKDMVSSYLFNSQLLSIDDEHKSSMLLVAPMESYENQYANKVINNIIKDSSNPIDQVEYVNCRQSMRNGGGPACLRLRVVMSDEQASALSANVVFTEELYNQLVNWVNKYYRDHLTINDLLDPNLVNESYQALDTLTKIMQLGSVYEFQK